ncbi:hypothetical protein ABZS96_29780 [Streptomyces avermitilis]|uniref:hypothetical protein n=1 Tax=Streptomyces avermitilis TaxID=33903 RepID=UPI0033B2352C
MTDNARQRLAEALERGDDLGALDALRWSLVWSAQAVQRQSSAGSAASAVEAVFLLDDALTETGTFARAVPRLLSEAEPGPDVEGHLRDRQHEIAEVRQLVAECRRTLDTAAEKESELRARLAEHEELRARVTELRRLERLIEVLDEIKSQRGVVEERLVLLRDRADGTETALDNDSAELLTLTRDQLSRLAPALRMALERAAREQAQLATAEEALADTEQQLVAYAERLTYVRTEHEVRLAELEAHTRADCRLADALSEFSDTAGEDGEERTAVERARTLVDDVEERLRQVDRALRHALDLREKAGGPGRSVVAWNDEDPSAPPAV